MEFNLTIELGNAAFDPDPEPELAYILRHLATTVGSMEGETKMDAQQHRILDTSGNTVGHWQVTL